MEIIVYYRARSSEGDGMMRLVFEVSPAGVANRYLEPSGAGRVGRVVRVTAPLLRWPRPML